MLPTLDLTSLLDTCPHLTCSRAETAWPLHAGKVATSLARLDDALDKALYQPPDKEKPLLLRLAEATDAHGPVVCSCMRGFRDITTLS